ncbi:hypothetical protein BCR42DRAFT_446260 [Absidia repens]|uniref:Uncharacterized protein n=1 Tax=Absidia repens TaxID=90262 RepID=A0A1X2IY90_9FUNG|nr:hypothetical protein BCR42DRAFT_446260 [Absidia repens]
MLRPLYTNRATKVLLVGPASSGKRTLANQLMRSPKIFYSTHLMDEMDMDCFDRLVDMDYVLIFVDMTNTASLKLLEDTFAHMEPEYLLYKCAIIFTKVDMVNLWMLDEDHVRHIIEQHGSPYTFYANLQDELLRRNIGEQITRAICIGTFQQRQVHPLGVKLLNNRDFNNNDTTHVDNDHYGQEDQNEYGQSQHDEDQDEHGGDQYSQGK